MKHYDNEINLFIDCELPDEQNKELFIHLEGCKECQNTFSEFIMLKEKTRTLCMENLNQVKNKPEPVTMFYKFGFYTSVAAAIILLFLLTTEKPKEIIITKNKVRVDTVFVSKESPTSQKQITVNSSLTPGKKELLVESSQKEYLRCVMNLRSEKITDADLIKLNNGSYQ